MNHSQSLPEPSPEALSHSEKLVSVIRDEIENSDSQSVSFRRYMEMALYQPGLGYYVAGSHKIGEQGDFTTAPEISALFSQCIANQCAQILKQMYGRDSQKNVNVSETQQQSTETAGLEISLKVGGCLLELGAGSGKMACDILLELEQLNQLPERYYILDLSPDLIERQQNTIRQNAPHLFDLVEWISSLPENFVGIILGNEVLDAMPVDVFTQTNNEVFEHHVIWEDDKLIEQLKPANDKLKKQVEDLNINPESSYTSEINPNLNGWMKNLNDSVQQALVLLIDYGYTQSEYYLAERNKGTLICHYQHLVNEAPLYYPGLQDITANVDFTAVAEAADASGFEVSGFTSQVHFLANTGLEDYFMKALEEKSDNKNDNNEEHQYRLAQQVRTLSLPSEMGERFKCIALSKGFEDETDTVLARGLIGFENFDQRFRL